MLFQGGEALLEYDTIRDALERLGEQPRIKYQIQTNGTLITNDIMNFLKNIIFMYLSAWTVMCMNIIVCEVTEHNTLQTRCLMFVRCFKKEIWTME